MKRIAEIPNYYRPNKISNQPLSLRTVNEVQHRSLFTPQQWCVLHVPSVKCPLFSICTPLATSRNFASCPHNIFMLPTIFKISAIFPLQNVTQLVLLVESHYTLWRTKIIFKFILLIKGLNRRKILTRIQVKCKILFKSGCKICIPTYVHCY